ncbi:MAG: YitT family protein [Acholeplasma sp.]|nr:YitT family protein [Acholeplasma sp.]
MKKINDFLKSPQFKERVLPEIKRFFAVTFFTLIYGIGVVWFLEKSEIPMYTGGMPGLAQVLRDILVKNGSLNNDKGNLFMSIFVLISNVPILLLGWFGVSKKFTLYSLVSVLIQSLVIGFIPDVDLGLSSSSHALLASILGGLFIGVGVGGALKYGTSTGGVDIIAQYLSFKKGKTVGFISLALNFGIALVGALVTGGKIVNGVEIIPGLILSYTILRIIVTTIATDKIHTSYQYLSIEIITETPQVIVDEILHKIGRGVTISKVEGAYSHHEKTMVMVVIATYELQMITEIIRDVDDKAFVVAKPVKSVIGNFKKKRIA